MNAGATSNAYSVCDVRAGTVGLDSRTKLHDAIPCLHRRPPVDRSDEQRADGDLPPAQECFPSHAATASSTTAAPQPLPGATRTALARRPRSEGGGMRVEFPVPPHGLLELAVVGLLPHLDPRHRPRHDHRTRRPTAHGASQLVDRSHRRGLRSAQHRSGDPHPVRGGPLTVEAGAEMEVGDGCVIMEQAVLRASGRFPLRIGRGGPVGTTRLR
jgi:hypothetical protein